ncbi:MAG: hypothetical protein ACXIU8_17350 [Alkalilacustris sp.]
MVRHLRSTACAGLVTLVCVSGAAAASFDLTFTSEVSRIGSTGSTDAREALGALVAVGDLLTITVTVDNGATSPLSQMWDLDDVVSATVTAGGYSGTWTGQWFRNITDPAFETDETGALVRAAWRGSLPTTSGTTDSFGTGGQLFSNSVVTSNGASFFYDPTLASLDAWAGPLPPAAPIPLPPSLGLLLGGLAVLAGAAARRRRSA